MAAGGQQASVQILGISNVTQHTADVEIQITPGTYPVTGGGLVFGTTSWFENYQTPYPPYFTNSISGDGTNHFTITIDNLDIATLYYVTAFVTENNADFGNGIWYSNELGFSTLDASGNDPTAPDPVDPPPAPEQPPEPKEILNRTLSFKLELLDSAENVIAEKSVSLIEGKVDVGSGGFRRKCSFDLAEAIDPAWQSHRFKLYYGSAINRAEPEYTPLGVFIPINPREREAQANQITSLQGVDKTKLFADYELDAPIQFTSGTSLRSIIQTVAGWFSETKLTIETDLGTLGADFSFEEGSTAEQLLNTLVSSFNCEWFYDTNGFLVARKRTDPASRAIKYQMDRINQPYYLEAERDIDDSNYYNRVTVVGGKADTPIYRQTYENATAIAKAGGRIVQRYFTIDAAVTQAQVDGRAAFYLSNGILLPAKLKLTSLVLPDLEIGDIIEKGGVRYEVRQFDVPLSLAAQNITAGEITQEEA